MRCPKCSFTSFDHLVTCEKCGRDLTELVDQLHGTSLKVESPLFLGSALEVAAAEETFDVAGDLAGNGVALELDTARTADGGAEDFIVADEISLDREPDQVTEEAPSAPDSPGEGELRLQTEGAFEEPVAEISAPAAATEEGQAGPTGLNFEGLDLSDLAPADNQETEGGESGNDEERPLDLWTLDTSGEHDLADLFDDLLPPEKTDKQDSAAGEQAAAAGGEGGDPAESATGAGDQPEKDDRDK